jgi:hypothetical protein
MEKLDITKYKPYKNYIGICKFKPMEKRKLTWPDIDKKYI